MTFFVVVTSVASLAFFLDEGQSLDWRNQSLILTRTPFSISLKSWGWVFFSRGGKKGKPNIPYRSVWQFSRRVFSRPERSKGQGQICLLKFAFFCKSSICITSSHLFAKWHHLPPLFAKIHSSSLSPKRAPISSLFQNGLSSLLLDLPRHST